MNGSRITDSPIANVLLIIGSVIAVMALVCVIIQLYKIIFQTEVCAVKFTVQISLPSIKVCRKIKGSRRTFSGA